MSNEKAQTTSDHVPITQQTSVAKPQPTAGLIVHSTDTPTLSHLSSVGALPLAPGNNLSHPTATAHQTSLFRTFQRHQGNAFVQRAIAQERSAMEISDQATEQASSDSSPGQSLDTSVRKDMEARFGHDFSRVRVHTDSEAANLAQGIHAQAFTRGQDIYLGDGQYQPGTEQGRHLLAHELTHTIQQDQHARTAIQSSPIVSQPGDPLEQEAEATAEAVLSGSAGLQVESRSGPILQRLELFGSSPPKTERELIEAAIASNEPSDVKHIHDFKQASEKQKFELIDILLNQTWVGPFDEYALEAIWDSFGEQVLAFGSAHFDVWMQCVDRGAELDKLAAVEAIKAKFKLDVKATANHYLFANREYLLSEMQALGLLEAADKTTPKQDMELQAVQIAAKHVIDAQSVQNQLRGIQVGYNVNKYREFPATIPAFFDPENEPDFETGGSKQPPLASWGQVKKQYDNVTAVISGLTNRYPALFAVVSGGNREELQQFTQDDPQKARAAILQVMQNVSQKIEETVPKIESDKLDYRDLVPIHEQLYHGQAAPSGTPWSNPLYTWIAKDVIGDYKAKEFWISLGLGTLAAAAFIVAEIATAGSATFFMIGLGIGVFQAGKSWEKYLDLAQAAQTNVSPETALVSQGQASAALLDAVLNTAFLFLQAYSTASKSTKGILTIIAERKAAELAERETVKLASKEAEAVAAKKLAEEMAAEKAVQDLGKEAGKNAARAVSVKEIGAAFWKGARGKVKEVEELVEIIEEITANQATKLRELAEIAANRGSQSLEDVIENFTNLPPAVQRFLQTPSSSRFYKAWFGTALQHMAERELQASGAVTTYDLILRKAAQGGIPDVQMVLKDDGTRVILDWTSPGQVHKIWNYNASDVSYLIEIFQPGP